MKKRKHQIFIAILLAFFFIIISVLTFRFSNQAIEDGYLASEGNAAKDFAALTASCLKLSDEQVTKLKNMSYQELKNSSENNYLREMMDNDSFTSKVDYAYVMIHLDKNDVKYKVTASNQKRFDTTLGTPLDIMWLLDVNVSKDAQESETLEEIERYSYYIEEDNHIFNDAPTYIYNTSEWGNHICGYAPLYTIEGNYIGVVGIELQTNDYNEYRNRAIESVLILFISSSVALTAVFVYIYLKYRRLQLDKIYTDPLTKLNNRSYYNNRFIKHFNRIKKKDCYFSLMIVDIDWFKKVNDTFGHEIGDQVLIEVAEILVNNFGKANVVRFGGEEFVIGLWIRDKETLCKRIDRLYQDLRDNSYSRYMIDITISLGGSYYRSSRIDGWLLSSMLKAADYQLYEVKENGRNNYRCFEYDSSKDYTKKNS